MNRSNLAEGVIALLDDTPPEAQRRIAGNLRERRVRMNLSRSELAERSGVSPSTLKKFELTGHIQFGSFVKIAKALGVMNGVIKATGLPDEDFGTMDDLIAANKAPARRKHPYSRRKSGGGK